MAEQPNLSATGSRPTGYSFQAMMPGIANYCTISTGMPYCPGSEPYILHSQRPTLIREHHAQPVLPVQHHSPWSRLPKQHEDQVDLTGRDDSPQPEPEGTDQRTDESTSSATVFFNPQNKKQVTNMHTLRDFPCNLETVDDLTFLCL